MTEPLDRERVQAFLEELAAVCARHGIQADHGRESMMLAPLQRDRLAGYAARFGFSAGWRLELVPRKTLKDAGVMPREFGSFD